MSTAPNVIRRVMSQSETATVIIMEMASRYITERLDQHDVNSFNILMQSSMNSSWVRTTQGKKQNLLADMDADSENSIILDKTEPEDLLKFGIIPEFVGRVPVIGALHPLTKENLVQILTVPKNSLVKQYQALFKMEGISLEFSPEALDKIASIAIEKKTGARGLRAITEGFMLELMYSLPEQKNKKDVLSTPDMIPSDEE